MSPINETAKRTLLVLASLLCGELAAQPFKCTDAAGKITYSGSPCKDLGLKDAGEIKDRLNTSPAYRPPPAPRSSAPDPAAKAPNTETQAKEPDKPERRCFTVQLGGGKVATRCNDKPEE